MRVYESVLIVYFVLVCVNISQPCSLFYVILFTLLIVRTLYTVQHQLRIYAIAFLQIKL